MKATTEQIKASENMAIARSIEHDTFLLWEEEHEVGITCLDFLFEKVKNPKTDEKVATSIAEFLINKIYADPVKKTDITSGGKGLEVIINTNLDLDETEI